MVLNHRSSHLLVNIWSIISLKTRYVTGDTIRNDWFCVYCYSSTTKLFALQNIKIGAFKNGNFKVQNLSRNNGSYANGTGKIIRYYGSQEVNCLGVALCPVWWTKSFLLLRILYPTHSSSSWPTHLPYKHIQLNPSKIKLEQWHLHHFSQI